jgi:hypothetical protein
VCDFVENFLLKHEIPCAYLNGRKISAVQAPDLGDTIQRLLLGGKTSSFEQAAQLLSEHAARVNMPFVLVIDGLNEHRRIPLFAEQLEVFIPKMLNHPHLKLLLTCRSEFFDARFGSLTKHPLLDHTFLFKAQEQRMAEAAHEELIDGYFKFFKLRKDLVAKHVVDALKRDVLLLRFFCEAYGAKGKPKGYPKYRSTAATRDAFRFSYPRPCGFTHVRLWWKLDTKECPLPPTPSQQSGGTTPFFVKSERGMQSQCAVTAEPAHNASPAAQSSQK